MRKKTVTRLRKEINKKYYYALRKCEMDKLKVDLASGFIRAMLPKEGIYPDPEEIVGMAVLYAEELIKQVTEK